MVKKYNPVIIHVEDRDFLDEEIRELIQRIANYYYDGDIEEAVGYFELLADCM